MNGIGKIGMSDGRQSISEWKVCIPFNVDRVKYIKNCFLTGTVSVTNSNGEYVDNVKVGKLAIQEIDFPVNEDFFGSDVICARLPYSGRLCVIEVMYDYKQFQQQKENQYAFVKKSEDGSVAMLLDGNGNVIVSVNGNKDNGVFTLNVTNAKRNGVLKINVNGAIEIDNDGEATIKSNQVKIISDKILLNESKEPVLLGNKTVQLISDLLDQLGKESAGPYPLLGNSVYLQLKEDIEDLKSKISFVK